MTARALAIKALCEWRDGHRFIDAILQDLLARYPLPSADRGFATELVYGVVRQLALLDFWIGRLRPRPVDDEARDLLRLGLYQLFLLRTPGHAAVFETVALAAARQRPLVNAVLRSAQRRMDELSAAAAAAPLEIRQSHPAFLMARWTRQYGAEAAAALCEWNNQPAPIYARRNPLRAAAGEVSEDALAEAPGFARVHEIPWEALARGECYLQDPSTRVACELLDPQPGEVVLDACAAPGGKAALLAALMKNRGQLVACDRDAARVKTLRENLDRLGVTNACILQRDWLTAGASFEAGTSSQFDRILLDAPCTNTGVMRRRVDVRWRLRADDFTRMAREQFGILRALFPLLKPGGTLVYSTCSLEREENEDVVAKTLAEFPGLELSEQKAVLPFRDGFDGAFAARLTRVS